MQKFLGYKGRSTWKGYFIKRLKNSNNLSLNNLRNVTITNKYTLKTVYVHTGRSMFKFTPNFRHVGYKYGQFIFTKKTGHYIHLEEEKQKRRSVKKKKGK